MHCWKYLVDIYKMDSFSLFFEMIDFLALRILLDHLQCSRMCMHMLDGVRYAKSKLEEKEDMHPISTYHNGLPISKVGFGHNRGN